jgi:hypothetical protein
MERTAHPDTPPTSFPSAGRRRWAPLSSAALLALAACACTPAGASREAAPHSPAYGTAMNATTLSMSAEDVSRRMLRLFTSVRGPNDITPARIRELTGIEVRYGSEDPKQYGFGEAVDDTWIYNLVSLPGPDGKPDRLMFSFDDQSHGHADMTPVCALGFDDYAKALTDAGFASRPRLGRLDRVKYWEYTRGDVTVQVYVRGQSAARADRLCVSMMIVNV